MTFRCMKDFDFNCWNTFDDLRHSICFHFWHRFLLIQEAFRKELDTQTQSIVRNKSQKHTQFRFVVLG